MRYVERREALRTEIFTNLYAAHPKLKEMLDGFGGMWGYEDGVYRFYHQSFKVFGLQDSTMDIVRALIALAPSAKFCAFFETIVRRGTGKKFDNNSNSNWVEETAPIVEAFFHARYFLEMAVKYGGSPIPDGPMDSGVAALLSLYELPR